MVVRKNRRLLLPGLSFRDVQSFVFLFGNYLGSDYRVGNRRIGCYRVNYHSFFYRSFCFNSRSLCFGFASGEQGHYCKRHKNYYFFHFDLMT